MLKDFIVRAPVIQDAQSVYELVIKHELENNGEIETGSGDIQTSWQAPSFNLETDAWVVLTPEGQLVGYGGVWCRDGIQIYAASTVDAAYLGRGIGTQLLELEEARAQELMALAPAGVRITLNRGTISTNQSAIDFYEQHDYKLVRHFYTMVIDMQDPPPTPQLPPQIKIRTFVIGQDERAVYEADNEAFSDHWGFIQGQYEEWENWSVKRAGFDPSLWFLAVDGHEIAGITLCHNNLPQMGWIDIVGMRRKWRKQGIALAGLHHAFGEFYRLGRRRVGLGVDAASLTGATRLYERAGMHVARQYNRYEKELRSGKEVSVQTLQA